MTTKELRNRIQPGLKIVDRRTLKMIDAILWEALAPDDGIEEKELLQELKRQEKALRKGKLKTYTIEEVRKRFENRQRRRSNKRKGS